MNPKELNRLRQLAKAAGVQLSYQTMSGEEQIASPESLRGVLTALGHDVSSGLAVDDALAAMHRQRWGRAIDPVVVCWDGKPTRVIIRVQRSWSSKTIRSSLLLEGGEVRVLPNSLGGPRRGGAQRIEGSAWIQRQLALPAVPIGYHRIRVETPSGIDEALLIAAPTRSYSEPGVPKRWGLFLPTYALHSKRSWGAGNLRDWCELSDWTASLGGNIVGSLPLLAAFLGRPVCEPSPYSPASRLFWNEFYLDIEGIPEFKASAAAQRLVQSPAFQKELASIRRSPQIDYDQQMGLRRRVLQRLARIFFAGQTHRHREFKAFLRDRPQVQEYARFRAACEGIGRSWHTWEEPQRSGKLRAGDYEQEALEYHLYVQWLAQEQMSAAVQHCRNSGVQFYLDLPLGVHPDGYDVWRHRDVFTLKASAGAPPDSFFSKGQDWGFAPLHPAQVREQRYDYVLDYLRFQMRHTGLLRIDHVMGLHRLYWVPHGLSPKEGAYVTYPAEELYALLSIESHRHKTTLIGENLGTVPPAVNAGMKRHGLRQMYVVQIEQQPDGRRALRPPPRQCVASINTHDMPTFASHFRGLDIRDRADLGLIPRGTLGREREQRRRLMTALLRFLRAEKCLPDLRASGEAALAACIRWLGRSDAEVVLISLEDLWLEEMPQNTPGTYRERPNWKRKCRLSLEEIRKSSQLRELLQEVSTIRHGMPKR